MSEAALEEREEEEPEELVDEPVESSPADAEDESEPLEAAAPSDEQPAAADASSGAERATSKRPRPADAHIADELSFPASSIARIVKASMPASMNLAKDARTAFARAATIFALYVTSTANDICKETKRSTISANDVYNALDELEFDMLTPEVKEFVEAFRAAQLGKAKKGGPADDDGARAALAAE